jgi:hypothetical protein
MIESEKLTRLLNSLPGPLRSDWEGTNHYELQNVGCVKNNNDFWWLTVPDIDFFAFPSDSKDGKNLGLVLDIIEEVSRLHFAEKEKES